MEVSSLMQNGTLLPPAFQNEARSIAQDAIQYTVHGKEDVGPPPSKAAQVMRELVDDALNNRDTIMTNLVKRLQISKKEDLQLLRKVADEMFCDDTVTWARVVTLHAFCGYVARFCYQKLVIPDSTEEIVKILTDFVVHRLGLWIVAHGSWKSFEQQFPSVRWNGGGVWKGLMIVGLFIGAVMSLYVYVRNVGPSKQHQNPN